MPPTLLTKLNENEEFINYSIVLLLEMYATPPIEEAEL